MQHYWGRTIRARFVSGRRDELARLLAALLAAAGALHAQNAPALVESYRSRPTVANLAALQTYIQTHAKDVSGGQASLGLGRAHLERKLYRDAIPALEAARKKVGKLSDYAAVWEAAARFELGEYPQAWKAATDALKHGPETPLTAEAVTLAVRAAAGMKQNALGRELLAKWVAAERLSESRRTLLEGELAEAAGQTSVALVAYQAVLVRWPLGKDGEDAEAGLARLRTAGTPTDLAPAVRLERALALLEKQPGKAKLEADAALALLPAAQSGRAMAQAIGCAAQVGLRQYAAAEACLQKLDGLDGEAGALAAYYRYQALRRLNRAEAAVAVVDEAVKKHPHSPWTLRAMVAAANSASMRNDRAVIDRFYKACHERFPNDTQAAYCHWKTVWFAYLDGSPDAVRLFQRHAELYPTSDKTATALYFLGRLAERGGFAGGARAYYDELARRYPNYYYAMLARERLKDARVAGAKPAGEVQSFLKQIALPEGPAKKSFDENGATRARGERARLLAGAGLQEFAEAELRYGAARDGQPHVMAMAMGDLLSNGFGSTDRALRTVKVLVPDYLRIPLDGAPERFWKLAYPIAYRGPLEGHSRERDLDPYLVAGLVRQESEFNARAVSPSKAYGLTQVLPSTGRELSRRLGVRGFTTARLFDPDLNLKLGTYYLRSLINSFNGQVEPALASYNGGKARVDQWITWYRYQEPAEFIETIPISETRDYVQIVVRNADFYRRLYGAAGVPSAAAPAKSKQEQPLRASSPARR